AGFDEGAAASPQAAVAAVQGPAPGRRIVERPVRTRCAAPPPAAQQAAAPANAGAAFFSRTKPPAPASAVTPVAADPDMAAAPVARHPHVDGTRRHHHASGERAAAADQGGGDQAGGQETTHGTLLTGDVLLETPCPTPRWRSSRRCPCGI